MYLTFIIDAVLITIINEIVDDDIINKNNQQYFLVNYDCKQLNEPPTVYSAFS